MSDEIDGLFVPSFQDMLAYYEESRPSSLFVRRQRVEWQQSTDYRLPPERVNAERRI